MRERRIVLIVPPGLPGTTANHEGSATLGAVEPTAGAFRYPPHTVAATAAALRAATPRAAGYDVVVIDAAEMDAATCVAATLSATPSLVGVFVSWATREGDALLLRTLRGESRLIVPVVALGVSTRYMQEWLQEADYLLVGEPEGSFPALCDRLLSSDVALPRVVDPAMLGVAGYDADGLLTDLDALPIPAWDVLPVERYAALSVLSSRGCEAGCTWCPYVVAQGRRYRACSPERVVAELVEIVGSYQPRKIVFRDPVFAHDRERVAAICRLILAENALQPGKNLTWECESRPDHFDSELLQLMSLAGCVGVKVGLETTDADVLVQEGRCVAREDVPAYLQRVRALVADCARLGIAARLFVLAGLPGQSVAAAQQTAAFVADLQPDTLTVKPLRDYPGLRSSGAPMPAPEAVAEQARALEAARPSIAGNNQRTPRWRRALARLVARGRYALGRARGESVAGRVSVAGEACPLCGEPATRLLYTLPDFRVFRCPRCALVLRDARPNADEAAAMYDDPRYVESDLFANWHADYDEQSAEVRMFEAALDRLGQATTPGKLLDVGCAKGLFLHLAQKRGWQPYGVEISRPAAAFARQEFGLEVFNGTLEQAQFPPESFDVVSLWDLIEHLDDPFGFLREAARVLKPGGIIVILTPNHDSLITRMAYLLYHASARHFHKPLDLIYDYHHNWYFSRQTITRALQQAGFGDVLRVDGMGAHVSRWQDVVRYPRVLEWGADALDLVTERFGGAYRMIVYARK
jgi:radical SAM superfamily enzyme YgiQ (UPF0313 family)/2-polyprenyl-3-methyl-5-hydroxy-6-metoxy-1,4-benzoquinol methylase